MAKIIYGIQSDGLGHYPRSKLIIDHLISNGHEILVLTSNRPYDLMKDSYNVKKIERITSIYKNNGVDYIKTAQNFIKGSSKRILKARNMVKKIFEEFNPDLVISDIEIFSAKIGIMKKIPVIYIGNSYSLIHTTATKDFNRQIDKIFLKNVASVLNMQSPNSKYVKKYFITSFFETKIRPGKKAELIPSLIREEIINIKKPKQKNHILVYQTSNTNKKLASILKSIPSEKFIIYGFDKNFKDKNLEFKKTSIKNNFIKDVVTCKAILTNGGFSLMSEGIFLKKPILSNPVSRQIEQIMNAVQLEKLGYGKHVRKLNSDLIKSFLYDLENYKENLKGYKQKDNSESFKKIDAEIKKALEEKPISKRNLKKIDSNFSVFRTH